MGNSNSSSSEKSPSTPKAEVSTKSSAPSIPSTSDSSHHVVLVYLNDNDGTRQIITDTVKEIGARCMEKCIFVGLDPRAYNKEDCKATLEKYGLHNIVKHCLSGGETGFNMDKEAEGVGKLVMTAMNKLQENLSSMSVHADESSGPSKISVKQVYTINFPDITKDDSTLTDTISIETPVTEEFTMAGGNSLHYQKYMKYKYKYLMAKKQLENN
mgnify:CR=1 FL=1